MEVIMGGGGGGGIAVVTVGEKDMEKKDKT
jgi:hypothetical protein